MSPRRFTADKGFFPLLSMSAFLGALVVVVLAGILSVGFPQAAQADDFIDWLNDNYPTLGNDPPPPPSTGGYPTWEDWLEDYLDEHMIP
jgi:hypothetical protein